MIQCHPVLIQLLQIKGVKIWALKWKVGEELWSAKNVIWEFWLRTFHWLCCNEKAKIWNVQISSASHVLHLWISIANIMETFVWTAGVHFWWTKFVLCGGYQLNNHISSSCRGKSSTTRVPMAVCQSAV